jgi:uncharacterized protein (DUF302 family)
VNYGKTVKLTLGFSETVPKVNEAFVAQGSRTLTEIDVKATLQADTEASIEPYVILGACNPQLAHQALQVTRSIGLLLPGNVVVRQDAGGIMVEALDPSIVATLPGDSALHSLAATR